MSHAVVQLNMLRVFFDFHPFAILGNAVEAHVNLGTRKTWDEHTVPGYYLGPSWEHYRCHDVWVQETRAIRTGQTVFF